MLGRVLPRSAAPAAAALVLTALLSGCSGGPDDCAGESYAPDLSEEGAATPVEALNAWLAGPTGFDELPPDDSWIVEDTGRSDSDEQVVRSDVDDGWWVHVVRTDDGGYVVDQVTDDWASCEDELS